MGIPLDILSLYELCNWETRCQHYLLLRVRQAAFSNADQGEYNYVTQVAEAKRDILIKTYITEILADECVHFEISLLGESQGYVVGDELYRETGRVWIDIWVAATRFGDPWIVMGTAEDEAAFWWAVEQDEDLIGLGTIRPARKQRVFLLTDNDIPTIAALL